LNIGKFLISDSQTIDLKEFPHLLNPSGYPAGSIDWSDQPEFTVSLEHGQTGFQGLNLQNHAIAHRLWMAATW